MPFHLPAEHWLFMPISLSTFHRGDQTTRFLSLTYALLCCHFSSSNTDWRQLGDPPSSAWSGTHLSVRMPLASESGRYTSNHTSRSNYRADPLPTCANAERRELLAFVHIRQSSWSGENPHCMWFFLCDVSALPWWTQVVKTGLLQEQWMLKCTFVKLLLGPSCLITYALPHWTH